MIAAAAKARAPEAEHDWQECCKWTIVQHPDVCSAVGSSPHLRPTHTPPCGPEWHDNTRAWTQPGGGKRSTVKYALLSKTQWTWRCMDGIMTCITIIMACGGRIPLPPEVPWTEMSLVQKKPTFPDITTRRKPWGSSCIIYFFYFNCTRYQKLTGV